MASMALVHEDGESNRSPMKIEDGKTNQNARKELTVDLIIEILLKLPVLSLLRFKCVCRIWYDLIMSPSFISLYYSRNQNKNKVSLFHHSTKFSYSLSGPEITAVTLRFDDVAKTLAFNPPIMSAYIVGCFNGVVCLSISASPRPAEFVLWNPAIRQFRHIACLADQTFHPDDVWCGYGFCFDPVANAFKVAQIKLTSTEDGDTTAHVRMFSTVTNLWTEKKIGVPYRMGGGSYSIVPGSTLVNRFMHWRIDIFDQDFTVEDMYILSYDMIAEVFKRIELPFQPMDFMDWSVRLSGYKGSLAVFVDRNPDIDVWVMKENCSGTNQPWSKLLTCRPSIDVKYAVGFLNNDGVSFVLNAWDDCFYLYDSETQETRKLWEAESFNDIFQYSESLALLRHDH